MKRTSRSLIWLCGVLVFLAWIGPGLATADSEPVASELPAPDSESVAEPGHVKLLGEWLQFLARQDKQARITTGTSSLIASAGILGFGIWAFLEDPPNNELNRGIGLLAVAAAGPGLSLGILELAMKSGSEKRWARWEATAARSMSSEEIGRFEGELRSYSLEARRNRMRGRWSSFGLFVTGGLLLGLTPAADLGSDGQTVGYVTGGVAAAVGLVGFGFSFARSFEEEYWDAYLQGRRPPRYRRWRTSPAFGRTFAGMTVGGEF